MSIFYLIVCLCVCVCFGLKTLQRAPQLDPQVVRRSAAVIVSSEESDSEGWAVRTRLYNPSSDGWERLRQRLAHDLCSVTGPLGLFTRGLAAGGLVIWVPEGIYIYIYNY